MKSLISTVFIFIIIHSVAFAGDSLYTQKEIIYGRKDGMALTMIQLKPKNSIHRAIISVVSGNFISTYDWVPRFTENAKVYLEKGFTVFLVMHGSQPRYTIPDEIADIKRAVKYIRYYAKDFEIDPDKMGITGSSAGGHLSLMIGLSSDSTIDSKDPIDKVSARVQAVGVFYPPTDFLNYGNNKFSPLDNEQLLQKQGVAGAFDFKELDKSSGTYKSITDPKRRLEIAAEISPVTHVSPDDPGVFIIHGDADIVVPLQQSKWLVQKLTEANVYNQLIVKPGKGHGWQGRIEDEKILAEWFLKRLN